MTGVQLAPWQQVAAAKQAARDALIPAEWLLPSKDQYDGVLDVLSVPESCGILSPAELKITGSSADVILARIREGAWTSVDVATAFCKRAAIAQQLTNCLTEILFTQALARAKELDEHFAKAGKTVGPLHGLPVSLKDNFYVESADTTVGFVAWANDPATAEQESIMTRIMREQGALVFCKTNVPTAMMMPESYNNVWGYTSNPFNRKTSSGGSSGGESALLALKGSPLGVGTDIGGSIRIPASFCGLYSLKPSFGRFPTYGARSGMPGQEAVRSINGPMSASLEAVQLWMKAVLASEPWLRDPNVIRLPFREDRLDKQRPMYIGLVMDNGIVRPTPAVTRALNITRKALEAAGHVVVEWCLGYDAELLNILYRLFEADGGEHIASFIAQSGEPYPLGMKPYEQAYEAAQKVEKPNVADYWKLQAQRTALAKKCLDAWMASAKMDGSPGRPFDAVISPATPWPACPQYQFGRHFAYTSIWNILDQPAATFPVTIVDPQLDVKPTDFAARNEAEDHIWQTYDPKELQGVPVALQCIGPRLEEELVLSVVDEIRQVLSAQATA